MGRIQTVDFSKVTLEEMEAIFNNPPHRYNTMSPMLNKMIGGWRENSFNLLVSSSGTGKSMMCFSNIAYGFASKHYIDNKWVNNPCSSKGEVLYIGTELDLTCECNPQIACCVGAVDYNKLKKRKLSAEEYDRYVEALEVLYNDRNIILKYDDDYNFQSIRDMVNSRDEIKTVVLDYLEVTPALSEEQPDPILALNNLARLCKNDLAKNKTIIAMAQSNIDLKDKKLGEIGAEYIKGSHTMHHKADTLLFLMKGSTNDLNYLIKANPTVNFGEYFDEFEDLSKGVGSALTINPDRIRKVLLKDKIRNCSVPSGTCLWCYVEPGTLRWHDLFVTDSEYKIFDVESTLLKDGKIL